jgi:hypothetical protein
MNTPDRLLDRNSAGQGVLGTAAGLTLIDLGNVTPAKNALQEVPYVTAVEALLTAPPFEWDERSNSPRHGSPVEACSRYEGKLVAGVHLHPVVAATHLAFNDHRPLVLSPDGIWLLVAQGFANHVNANADDLRRRLVRHAGKVVIQVRRDNFIKGSPDNPWAEALDEFTRQIREHVSEGTHDLLRPTFSTTGPAERAAAQIVLLDAMQSYCRFEFETVCGIPQIVLEGTVADWDAVALRTRDLDRFGLDWWVGSLAPILGEVREAARGHVNLPFWQSIYKCHKMSGGPFVSGWITAFFPYLDLGMTGLATNRNPWLTQGGEALKELLYPPTERTGDRFRVGPKTDQFPSGLARAPFHWNYINRSYEMEFLGGFVGVRQEADTLRLRPEIGWAVRDATAE